MNLHVLTLEDAHYIELNKESKLQKGMSSVIPFCLLFTSSKQQFGDGNAYPCVSVYKYREVSSKKNGTP